MNIEGKCCPACVGKIEEVLEEEGGPRVECVEPGGCTWSCDPYDDERCGRDNCSHCRGVR